MERTSPQEPRTIVVYATEIGCILGLNPYCSRSEVIKRKWYRIEGDDVPESFRPSPDFLKAIRFTKTGRDFRTKFYTIEQHAQFQDLVAHVKKCLEGEGRHELVDSAPGFVRTEMGKNSESLAIDIAETRPEIGQCRSQQERFFKRAWISNDESIEVAISGRIDCRDKEGRIVEIKTRIGRGPSVSPAETAQLQTYLFLAGEPTGYIVELYKGEEIFVNPKMSFDKQWWDDEVVPALVSFANDLTTSIVAKTLVIMDEMPSDFQDDGEDIQF